MSGESMSGFFMAFEASPSLRHNAESFIQYIHQGDRTPQHDLLQRVLDEFVLQCLETYFSAPAQRAGLGPMGRKIVVTAVATLRKTIQMVVGRIIRKLHNRDMQPLAEFIDGVLLRSRAGRQTTAFVAFPLDLDTVQQLRALQLQSRSAGSRTDDLVASFQGMADEAVTYFFADPVASLRLGPVLAKMAQLGIESSRSVIGSLIRRIFSTMTSQQLADTLDYFCERISTAEQLGCVTVSSQVRA